MAGHSFNCVIDTGAEVNVMDELTYRNLGDITLSESNKSVFAYGPKGDRSKLPILGTIDVEIVCNDTRSSTYDKFYVVRGEAGNLPSCESSEDLGLVTFNISVNSNHAGSDVVDDVSQSSSVDRSSTPVDGQSKSHFKSERKVPKKKSSSVYPIQIQNILIGVKHSQI